jgi:regulator of replication initiation timing
LQVSSSQVKKMNTSSMEREGEVAALRKKLESMVKLNKTLNAERTALQEKCKHQVGSSLPSLPLSL